MIKPSTSYRDKLIILLLRKGYLPKEVVDMVKKKLQDESINVMHVYDAKRRPEVDRRRPKREGLERRRAQ